MQKVLSFITAVFGWIFAIFCSGAIIASIGAFLVFQHYTKDLPDYTQLANYDPPTLTRLYANNGKLMAEYAVEKRVYVPLSAIPKRVTQAFLSAEDKNFYTHTGIDYQGIARAVFKNILNYGQGKSLVGGSTITQQVVKNFLLTNEKSIARKIREAVLAIRITNAYSKDRILELYLNEIFLGNRSYGIGAAALNYFNHSLDDLPLEEAALLAALPKAPTKYDPNKDYKAAKIRRDWVLERMYEDGYITEEEKFEAQKMPITLRERTKEQKIDAEYFAEDVRRWLADKLGNETVTEGGLSVHTTLDPQLQIYADEALRKTLIEYDRKRGYRGAIGKLSQLDSYQAELVRLTDARQKLIGEQQLATILTMDDSKASIGLMNGGKGIIPMSLLGWTRRVMSDGSLGAAAKKPADIFNVGDVIIVGPISDEQKTKLKTEEAKTAWDLQQVPLANGALVAMEPDTGKILALTGGYSSKISDFDRATQAMRQPGSAFKPFVYLSAFENGMTPSTLVLDAPVELNQGAHQETWKPSNYGHDYLGPTTLRRGLEKSRNTMTVRLGQALGIDRMLEVGKRFGIYDDPPRNFSIVLGASETSVVRLLSAYATITNGGKKVSPVMVERVDDRHGKVVFRLDERGCPTCEVDDELLDMNDLKPPSLIDTRKRIVDARVAYQITSLLEGVVKRGTAARAKGLPWSIGGKTGTTNESRDVWFMGISPKLVVGVFIGYDNPASLGAKETGSSLALPAFMEFVQHAFKDQPNIPFPVPSGVELVKVDATSGYAMEPWQEDGRLTLWETFIRQDIPLFKPESLLALGERPQQQYLMDGQDASMDISVINGLALPWLANQPQSGPYPTDPSAAPERNYRDAYRPQIAPPSSVPQAPVSNPYLPTNNETKQPSSLIRRISPPQAAPERRDFGVPTTR